MKFSAVLLFAEAIMAARLTEKRRESHAKRALSRKSHPMIRSDRPSTIVNQTNVEYSSNWAGAVITTNDVSEVTAVITVPTPSSPDGGSSWGSSPWGGGGSSSTEYCASAWVGIDGDTCETAILQTGVDFCIESGQVSYDAWYEWYPDYSYDFNLDVSSGDVIKMTVTATSDTSGTAVLENLTTGKTVTKTFSGNVEGDLCRQNAEWIVEDFEEGDSLVSFADFGTVTFSSATGTASGQSLNPEDGTVMDIEQDNEVLTSVTVSSDTVVVTYE